MILRSIAVQGWRCFGNEVRVGRFIDGINVIHGPNGAGKSTLFQAMTRCFLDGHRVGGEEAQSMRPWGRDLAPTVTVGFLHGGEEYRLRKRFLDRPEAELARLEGGVFVRLAEGERADERARQFLRANAPGRGLTDTRHWGLAQVLWTLQGDLSLKELTGDLTGDIRAMLGAQLTGKAGGPLEKKLEDLYAQFYTRTGKVKSGQQEPEAVRLQKKRSEVEDRLSKARQKLELFESMSRRLESLRAVQDQARRRAADFAARIEDARKRAESYRGVQSERGRQAARAKAAEAVAKELGQRIEEIQNCARRLREAREALDRQSAEFPSRKRAVADAEAAALQRKAELEDAQTRRGEVDAAWEQVDQARRYAAALEEASGLETRLDGIRAAQSEAAVLAARRTAILAPDRTELREIQEAFRDQDEADAGLKAVSISLEIVPVRDCSVTLIAGEAAGVQAVRGGTPGRFSGSPEVVADIEGFGRIRASGPAGSAEQYRRKLNNARNRLKAVAAMYGPLTLEQIESLHQQAAELDRQLGLARTRLETLLDGTPPEVLEQRLGALKNALSNACQAHPEWKENPPGVEERKRWAAEVDLNYRAAVASAQNVWETAKDAVAAAEKKESEAAARIMALQEQIQAAESRLSEITADGKSEEDRRREREAALLDLEAARAMLDQAEDRLKAYPEDPSSDVERLEREREQAEKEARNALEQEKLEEGRMANLSLEGPHSLVASAEEELACISSRCARETERMQAVKLLWETYSAAKRAAVERVAAPVEASATRTLERIAGRRLGGIRLDSAFRPERVRPNLSPDPVAVAEASGGEQEQIFFATRLALAEVLATEERPMIVLDDVLTATDTGRLARVMRILEEAAAKMQILILTCHPERYQGLRDASFFDLEKLVEQGS